MFTRRLIALRWWIIGLVALGTIVNYLTRSTLSVAAPTLMDDLGMTEQQYGWITVAFQIGIMMQPVVGYILDLIGVKLGLALFAAGWGVFTMAHGLATNWQGLAAVRGLLGFAEGTSHTGGLKVVSEWFPAKERGFASGIYNIGASLGPMLAAPLVAWAIIVWNWRAAFLVTGALAFLWMILWLLFYNPPEKHRSITAEELDLIKAGQEKHIEAVEAKPPVLHLLRQRNFWGIAIPRFLADPTWGTLTFWLPMYLVTVRGFDLKQIALFAWLPFVAADIGCLFGPAVTVWLQRRGIGLINARRMTFTLGALMMTSMMFVGSVESPVTAIVLFSVGAFAHQTLSITVLTMAPDLFRQNEVGTVAGMAGLCANFGVLLFTLAIGTFVATIGYDPFFIALGLLDLVAAIVLWTVVKQPRSNQGLDAAPA